MQVLEQALPQYRVHFYNDFIYKVVAFKRSSFPQVHITADDQREDPDGKFSQSYARARSVLLQLALCNKWDYFFTVTCDSSIIDRNDVDLVLSSFARWVIEYRRQFDTPIKAVAVPELHEKGGVHLHGFLSGVRPEHVGRFIEGLHPYSLVNGNYLAFPLLSLSFGYTSLSPIKNAVGAAFYMTKYLRKALGGARNGYYQHLYYASRGLRRAVAECEFYAYDGELEGLTVKDCDFCKVGWAIGDQYDFTHFLEKDGAVTICDDAFLDSIFSYNRSSHGAEEIKHFEILEGEQLTLNDFLLSYSKKEQAG